jgi:KDO2-lipid IV(A) lauroyltransferase
MRIAGLAASLGWYRARGTRRLTLEHLALAFPEKTAAEREAIGKACLVHLGWLAAEAITVHRSGPPLEEYVTFAPGSEEVLRRTHAEGRGLVAISGHIGHWELAAQRLVRAGIPSAAIARTGPDPKVDALLNSFRAGNDVEILLRDAPATARAMIRALKSGKLLGLLTDQDTRVQGVFVPFFGRLAFTPRAPGDLALRFKAPVIVIWNCRRGPRPGDGHELHVVQVPYDAEAADREAESVRITAESTAIMERAIRAHPVEWVWMHERWKTRPPTP